ncbi:MAG: hypothetical protein WEB03_12330 [Nitriliruptor sp.]|uniref:hypothetical protein n=1 Tax=Nitriliruptor sp. TaxID=2448056 RepID=UPI0034A043A9
MRDRIGVVLRVRRIQERLAQAEAAAAACEARRASDTRVEQERAHAERPVVGLDITPLQLRVLQLQGLASYAELAAASSAEDRTKALRDTARAASVGASVRRKGAERLVEQRLESAAVAVAANAQRSLDEMAVTRWRVH